MKQWLEVWSLYKYHKERLEAAVNHYASLPRPCLWAWDEVRRWRGMVDHWESGIYYAGEWPGGGEVWFMIRGKLYKGLVANSAEIDRRAPTKGSCGKLFNELKAKGIVFIPHYRMEQLSIPEPAPVAAYQETERGL